MPIDAPGCVWGGQGAGSAQIGVRDRKTDVAVRLAPIRSPFHTVWALSRQTNCARVCSLLQQLRTSGHCPAIGEGDSENSFFASKRPNRPHLYVNDCICLFLRELSTAPFITSIPSDQYVAFPLTHLLFRPLTADDISARRQVSRLVAHWRGRQIRTPRGSVVEAALSVAPDRRQKFGLSQRPVQRLLQPASKSDSPCIPPQRRRKRSCDRER